jgi:hypothetical protein
MTRALRGWSIQTMPGSPSLQRRDMAKEHDEGQQNMK